jgi:hypothetical protein
MDGGCYTRQVRVPLAASVLVTLLSPALALADGPVRAEGQLPGAAIDRFLARLVPVTFAVPGESAGRLAVVEARYCGTVDATRGRLLAVVSSGAQRTVQLRTGDCKEKLPSIARRGGTVAEILVAATARQLRLSLGEVAPAGETGAQLGAALGRVRAAGPLATVPTSPVPLRTAGGASQTYDLAIAFGEGDVVALAMAPVGRASPPRTDRAGAASEASVNATYGFANALLTLFTRDEPFTLKVEGQMIEIRSLELQGAEGTLTLKGRAQARGIAEVAHLAITASGRDLAITDARADAELEDCASLGTVAALACRARNGARAGAAAALATALLERYRGEPLRSLAPLPPASFELGGRRFDLRLTPTRLSATAAGLLASGTADLDPG